MDAVVMAVTVAEAVMEVEADGVERGITVCRVLYVVWLDGLQALKFCCLCKQVTTRTALVKTVVAAGMVDRAVTEEAEEMAVTEGVVEVADTAVRAVQSLSLPTIHDC